MTSAKPSVLAILGSTRQQSANRTILEHLEREYKDRLELHISDWPPLLPHFNADHTIHDLPLEVGMFREEIGQADAVLFCSPEYVFSVPAVVKNAIEWTVATTLFSGKPVAVVTASSAGEKAHESLVLILRTLYADLPDDRTLLISGVKARMDASGTITDEATANGIQRLMVSLLERLSKPEETP